MEKLAGNVSKPEQPAESSAPVSPSTDLSSASAILPEHKPSINATGASSPQNPFTKLGEQPSSVSPHPSIRIRPADGAVKREREPDNYSAAPPRKQTDTKVETVGEFEERSLSAIFRMTLEEKRQTDLSGHKLAYLSALKADLQDGGEPCRLSVGNLDQALMEAVSKVPAHKSPLEYLLPCWKRVLRAQKSLRGYANERDTILKEARRLCMSSCIFAVTMPELYG